jgi:FAD/FMN-containing dehydrogenase
MHRFGYWVMSEWPFGAAIRRHAIDPILFAGPSVSWRNYEASYDTYELEPASRRSSTYALQEYFVPVARFDAFVPRLRDVLRRHAVNVVNLSIRHATGDPGSLLTCAHSEVFAFVIYYKQAPTEQAQDAVGMWSRELIDAALDVQGSYYLPYQLHATRQQFYGAYPKAAEYFRLKRQVDPTNKFRNRFLDKYSPAMP